MEKKAKNGEVVEDRIYGENTPDNKLFMVWWERTANSGYFLVYAKDEKGATEEIGYSPKFVLFTVVEISRLSLPVQYGVRN